MMIQNTVSTFFRTTTNKTSPTNSSTQLGAIVKTYRRLVSLQRQSFISLNPFSLLPVHQFLCAHYNSVFQTPPNSQLSCTASSAITIAAALFSSLLTEKPLKFQTPFAPQPLLSSSENQQLATDWCPFALVAAMATIPKRTVLAARRTQQALPVPVILTPQQVHQQQQFQHQQQFQQQFQQQEQFQHQQQHQYKSSRYDCGEDAFFMVTDLEHHVDAIRKRETIAALGIADGVGGYSRLNIDPSLMAWQLMENAQHCIEELKLLECPRQVMAQAYDTIRERSQVEAGGCTACIVMVERDLTNGGLKLKSANLGDSGYLVVRGDKIIHRSQELTHGFNAPYQLSIPPKNHPTTVFQDNPREAHVPEEVELLEGDLILLGTDGLFDNLFDEEVQHCFTEQFQLYGEDYQTAVQKAAAELAQLSRDHSLSRSVDTPFAKAARENSLFHRGGKPDDITLIVARVCQRVDSKK